MILVLATARSAKKRDFLKIPLKISCFRSILFFIDFDSNNTVAWRMDIGFEVAAFRNPRKDCFRGNPIKVSEFVDRSVPIDSEPTKRISAKQTADSGSVLLKTYADLSSV